MVRRRWTARAPSATARPAHQAKTAPVGARALSANAFLRVMLPVRVGDSDCGAAGRRQHGACVPAQEGCRADADCRAGQVCDQGRCVADAAGCRMNSECAQGQVCRSGRCLTADTGDEGCRANSDCAEGQACRSGRCVTQQQQPPSSSGASCSTHSECPAGEACQQPEGRCTCWLGVRCDSDSQCAVSRQPRSADPWRSRRRSASRGSIWLV